VTPKVFASNTVEGVVAAAPVSIGVGPIAVDGAGMALPVVVTFVVPDMTWTSVGADVAFSMTSASVAVSLGPLTVTFTCEPKAPVATIVTAVVRGVTNLKAAPPPSGVLAAGAPAENVALARSGWSPFRYVLVGFALVDVGYLLWSSTSPRRRWRLGAPRPI
jgi:hypothetical protein